MNKKGFALTETLVVVVFLVTIFTFIYVSIIPLIGKYESMSDSENDIDIVYKLYHIRKMINSDENKATILGSTVSQITCDELNSSTFCNELMEQLDLKNEESDNYILIYSPSMNSTDLDSIKSINTEIGDYASKYKNKINNNTLFLLDTEKHTIAYLYYDIIH